MRLLLSSHKACSILLFQENSGTMEEFPEFTPAMGYEVIVQVADGAAPFIIVPAAEPNAFDGNFPRELLEQALSCRIGMRYHGERTAEPVELPEVLAGGARGSDADNVRGELPDGKVVRESFDDQYFALHGTDCPYS